MCIATLACNFHSDVCSLQMMRMLIQIVAALRVGGFSTPSARTTSGSNTSRDVDSDVSRSPVRGGGLPTSIHTTSGSVSFRTSRDRTSRPSNASSNFRVTTTVSQ